MLPTLVLLWLGTTPHTPDHERLLVSWATAHQLQLKPASLAPSPPPYRPEIANEIEQLLEDARSAIPRTERHAKVFSRLKRLIVNNPWLPQSAWLDRERQQLLARSLEKESTTRTPSNFQYGAPQPATPEPTAAQSTALQLASQRSGDEVVLDGEPLVAGRRGRIGDHHVQLRRAGVPIWIGWVSVDESGLLSIPEPGLPCSGVDLLAVRYTASAPVGEPGIQCKEWIAASARTDGSLQVSQCSQSHCSSWENLLPPAQPRHPASAQHDETPESMPAWLKWSLISAGSLAVTGVALWQSGVFDSREAAQQFEFTGPVSASF